MFIRTTNFITNLPKTIKHYVAGIFFAPGKKNCNQISRFFNCTHDYINQLFQKPAESIKRLEYDLLLVAKQLPAHERKALVIDDTLIKKVFGSTIEGRCQGRDSCTGKICYGLTVVLAGISCISGFIPINFEYWVQQNIMGDAYKKKWELAVILIENTFKKIDPVPVVLDALFCSIASIKAFNECRILFVMKMKSNMKICVNGVEVQIKHHPELKLYKNNRKKTILGTYKGEQLYFTVEKFRQKGGQWAYRYLVSNFEADSIEYIELYNLRWNIEKCNRTTKQLCGLADCVMRDIDKQKLHTFSVYHAYAQAELIKIQNGLPNTESVLHMLRDAKSKDPDSIIFRLDQQSRFVA